MIGPDTITGYDDLPLPEGAASGLAPRYYTRDYQDTVVRLAAVERSVLVAGRPVPVLVIVAQTRSGNLA